MTKYSRTIIILLSIFFFSASASASPSDLGTVGASGTGRLARSSNGLVMGIVFDTTVPPPQTRGAKALNQVRALKNLVQTNLKLGDYIFIQSVSRGYNGFYVADSGGGQHRWSGGLMLTLTKIGTADEEAAALASSDDDPYAKASVRTKDSIMQYIEAMEKDETDIIFKDGRTGHPNMQGAIYMARLLFKESDSMVSANSTGYKKALFIFSDGRFVASTDPMLELAKLVRPQGDWVDPDPGDPTWASPQLVMNDFGDGNGSVNRCTDSQANNSARAHPNDDDFQCFNYWNNLHRNHPTPLPPSLNLLVSQKIWTRVYIDSKRALHYDATCDNEASANALAAEQADLAREDNIIVYGFMPSINPDKSNLGAMQRLTIDKDLPECWVKDADVPNPQICSHYVGIVHWRFQENSANGCTGYGLRFTAGGEDYGDTYVSKRIPEAGTRPKRLYLNEDFGTVDLDAGAATNRERGFSLTID